MATSSSSTEHLVCPSRTDASCGASVVEAGRVEPAPEQARSPRRPGQAVGAMGERRQALRFSRVALGTLGPFRAGFLVSRRNTRRSTNQPARSVQDQLFTRPGSPSRNQVSPFRSYTVSRRIRLHGRQFVATGIEKMEAAAAGKTEDRFGDSRTSRGDSRKRRLQILNLDHG